MELQFFIRSDCGKAQTESRECYRDSVIIGRPESISLSEDWTARRTAENEDQDEEQEAQRTKRSSWRRHQPERAAGDSEGSGAWDMARAKSP